MAILIADVRTELQLTADVIDDTSIQYAIDKVVVEDINLVSAQVLRMVLSKYRGRVKLKIGKFEEWIEPNELRALIKSYVAKGAGVTVGDGFEHPEAYFTRDGI